MCVADFTDPQHVQYTYLCDHSLTISQNIVSCNIIPRHADNLSDHLPLCLRIRVHSEQCQPAVLPTDVSYGVKRRWDNLECTNAYRDILHGKLSTMHILTCDANDDSDAYETVNGSGGDFGMTMIDLVPGQCMKRTNISKWYSDVELGSA